jgi:hypothetical protein
MISSSVRSCIFGFGASKMLFACAMVAPSCTSVSSASARVTPFERRRRSITWNAFSEISMVLMPGLYSRMRDLGLWCSSVRIFAYPSGFNLFSSLDFWHTLENRFLLDLEISGWNFLKSAQPIGLFATSRVLNRSNLDVIASNPVVNPIRTFKQRPQTHMPRVLRDTTHLWEITQMIGGSHNSVHSFKRLAWRDVLEKSIDLVQIQFGLQRPNHFHEGNLLRYRSTNSLEVRVSPASKSAILRAMF